MSLGPRLFSSQALSALENTLNKTNPRSQSIGVDRYRPLCGQTGGRTPAEDRLQRTSLTFGISYAPSSGYHSTRSGRLPKSDDLSQWLPTFLFPASPSRPKDSRLPNQNRAGVWGGSPEQAAGELCGCRVSRMSIQEDGDGRYSTSGIQQMRDTDTEGRCLPNRD